MAAIGRLVRLAPGLKELSVLHRSICKANVALKPFKLPLTPRQSHKTWNLVRYCSSESSLLGNEAAAEPELENQQTLDERYSPPQPIQRLEPTKISQDGMKTEHVARDIADRIATYYSVSKKEVEHFVSVVEENGYIADKHDLILLLRCMGDFMLDATNEEKCEMVDQVWSKLKENNVNLDPQIYNTLLMVYIENDHPFSPAEILQEMQDNDVTPNMVTFKRLINAYCNKGDVTSGKQLLEFMQAENVPIGAEVFNMFIKGHMINGDLKNAEEVLQVMRDLNVSITDETFARILCGLADMKELSQIPKYLEELEQVQCRLSSVVDIMISMKKNGFHEFDSVLNRLMDSSVDSLSDYTTCVSKCLKLGHMDIVDKLDPLKYGNTQSQPSFIDNYIHCLKLSNLNEGTFRNKIKALITKCETNDTVFPSLTYIFYQHNLHDYGVEMLQRAKKKDLHVSPHCFFPAVIHYQKTGNLEKITDVLKTLMTFHVIENKFNLIYVASDVIPNLLENLDGEDNVLNYLKNNIPNNGHITAYFLYLIQYKSIDKALQFAKKEKLSIGYKYLHQCISLGLFTDHKTLSTVMELFHGNGHSKFKVHEHYLMLLLSHGLKNNAWDEVEDILTNKKLMIYSVPKSLVDPAPESIKKKIESYKESVKNHVEEQRVRDVFMVRTKLVNAVNNQRIDLCKFYLDKLFHVKDFKEYEFTMLQFVELCIEKKQLDDAVEYLAKFFNLHSGFRKNFEYDKKTYSLIQKAYLISETKAEELKVLFVENQFIRNDCQFFLSGQIEELLNKDLDDCTDQVIKPYKTYKDSYAILDLFQKLIKSEKHGDLQKVFDRMVSDLSEPLVFAHLALSLINCDQIQKALKVCSIKEANISDSLCKLISIHGQVEQVEHFIEATKYFSYRDSLLNALMNLYLNNRLYDKALGVVSMYEEEFLEMTEFQKANLVRKLRAVDNQAYEKFLTEHGMISTGNDNMRRENRGNGNMRWENRGNNMRWENRGNNMRWENRGNDNMRMDNRGNDNMRMDNRGNDNMRMSNRSNDNMRWENRDINRLQNEKESNKVVKNNAKDWFVNEWSLHKLYKEDKELFYKVTSEVQDNKRKLAMIFEILLVSKEVEKAKELLSKHPDIVMTSKPTFLFVIGKLNTVERILREDFSDRRDMLLKFHENRLCFIANGKKGIKNQMKNAYDKLLEDGFQLPDLDKEKVSDMELKLASDNKPIPWKTDSSKETIVTDSSKETIVSDSSKETIVTDSSKETIVPDIANETIGFSNETIVTDSSNETIVTDSCKETIVTDSSNETIVTDSSKETIVPDITNETIGFSNETIVTDSSNETIVTDSSNETIVTETSDMLDTTAKSEELDSGLNNASQENEEKLK